jgi:hypothetical protein
MVHEWLWDFTQDVESVRGSGLGTTVLDSLHQFLYKRAILCEWQRPAQ